MARIKTPADKAGLTIAVFDATRKSDLGCITQMLQTKENMAITHLRGQLDEQKQSIGMGVAIHSAFNLGRDEGPILETLPVMMSPRLRCAVAATWSARKHSKVKQSLQG